MYVSQFVSVVGKQFVIDWVIREDDRWKEANGKKGQRGVGYCLVSPLQNGLGGRPLPSRIRESICKKYLAVFLCENEDKPRVSSFGLILEILRQMAVALAWKERSSSCQPNCANPDFSSKFVFGKFLWKSKVFRKRGPGSASDRLFDDEKGLKVR